MFTYSLAICPARMVYGEKFRLLGRRSGNFGRISQIMRPKPGKKAAKSPHLMGLAREKLGA